jgi:serine protease Do
MRKHIVGVAAAVAVLAWAIAVPRAAAQADFLLLQGAGSSIGVTVREVTTEDAQKAKLAQPAGVLVESVRQGSPAASAGFQAGDIVLDFDGERVRSVRHFTRLVQETPPRRAVTAVVVRGTAKQTLQVTPETGSAFSTRDRVREQVERFRQLPRDVPRNFNFDFGPDVLRRRDVPGGPSLGLSLTPLGDQLAEYFGVKQGALVSSVGANTPAANAGLKAGDVITAVSGRSVSDASDAVAALRSIQPGESADVSVTREKKPLMLKLAVPARGIESGRRGLPI